MGRRFLDEIWRFVFLGVRLKMEKMRQNVKMRQNDLLVLLISAFNKS